MPSFCRNLKSSSLDSGLLSGIIGLTVLAVWIAMTYLHTARPPLYLEHSVLHQVILTNGLRALGFSWSLLPVPHLLSLTAVYLCNFSLSKDLQSLESALCEVALLRRTLICSSHSRPVDRTHSLKLPDGHHGKAGATGLQPSVFHLVLVGNSL